MEETITVPRTKDELRAAADAFLTTGWTLAAAVWAWTYIGKGGNPNLTTSGEVAGYSIIEFSRLGIRGLSSQDSVRKYRAIWQAAIDSGHACAVEPGETVEMPDLPFGLPSAEPGLAASRKFGSLPSPDDAAQEVTGFPSEGEYPSDAQECSVCRCMFPPGRMYYDQCQECSDYGRRTGYRDTKDVGVKRPDEQHQHLRDEQEGEWTDEDEKNRQEEEERSKDRSAREARRSRLESLLTQASDALWDALQLRQEMRAAGDDITEYQRKTTGIVGSLADRIQHMIEVESHDASEVQPSEDGEVESVREQSNVVYAFGSSAGG